MLQQSVALYEIRHGHLPTSLEQLVDDGTIRKYPIDPWGNAYQTFVRYDGTFVVLSAGRDGDLGTLDDIYQAG